MFIVGIDEAGLGPLLGPLVISAVGLHISDGLADADLWELLSEAINRSPKRHSSKVVIADSKKLYRGGRGNLPYLERGSLVGYFLFYNELPQSLRDFIDKICIDSKVYNRHKWYSFTDIPLPYVLTQDSIELSCSLLAQCLANMNARFSYLKAIVITEGRFNELVDSIGNKSEIVFSQLIRLIADIIGSSVSDGRIRIYIDRQGSRKSYLEGLLKSFPEYNIRVLTETESESRYILSSERKEVLLGFLTRGENRSFLISWASIVSKYIRELFMRLFNEYWQSHLPQLRPTAGYFVDGKRFIADIECVLRKLAVDKMELVRKL